MSGSVNKVILIGHVGKDPEIKSLPNGDRYANFSVATSESWTDKSSGERRTKTEWHNIVVWNDRLVDVCQKYLVKGKQVYLEGQLQTRKWTDQEGRDRYTTEIVLQRFRGEITLLGKKEEGEHHRQGQQQSFDGMDEEI